MAVRWPPCFFTAGHGTAPVIGGLTHQLYRGASQPPQPTAAAYALAALLAAMAVTAAAWAVRVPPVLLLPLEGAEAGTPSHCTRSMEVHLIRHAQGTHNLAEEDAHASGRHGASPEHARLFEAHGKAWVLLEQVSGRAHWDAPLTDEGWRQAVRLRREIETSGQSFDLVVASPMRRTLQTALAALPQLSSGGVRTIFPGPSDNLGCDESGDAVGTDASAAAAATEAAAAVADATIVESGATSMQHTAASPYRAPFALDGPATVPIIVSDLLRERVAHYTCDRRLPVSELRRVAFGGAAVATEPPHIDFEQGQVEEHDPMPLEAGHSEDQILAQRATRAAQWLLDLPTPPGGCAHGSASGRCRVAVVSHKHLLLAMTSALGEATMTDADGWHRRFANAERRAYLLCEVALSTASRWRTNWLSLPSFGFGFGLWSGRT